MDYKGFESFACVSFRTFIAWSMGRPLDEANNMDLDDEIKEQYFDPDPLIYDENGIGPNPDEFKGTWDCNDTVFMYGINIGPNGFYKIDFMVNGVQYSQDFDLNYISIPKLFEHAY